ncbi:hypothetical protein K466DRAFT_177930 [Polyporus arcularius HHB13444]|uniref:Uncharacterized protein n=1 Tax=Polyporus arcularius HHB13444 TaxID=1314778 RepID=A0A5C3P7Y7_9APHY|nr:hypothetical protein K466DRAFT_177930 [Polyporus arcularius HHB13444]
MDGERTVRGETRDGGETVGGDARSAPVRATCLFCICARRELIPPAAPPIFVFAIDRPAACLSIFRAPPRRSPYPAQRPRNLHRKTRPAAAPTRPARACRCSEVQPSAGLRPRREQETPLEPPSPSRLPAHEQVDARGAQWRALCHFPGRSRIPRTAVAPHQGRCPRSQCMTSNPRCAVSSFPARRVVPPRPVSYSHARGQRDCGMGHLTAVPAVLPLSVGPCCSQCAAARCSGHRVMPTKAKVRASAADTTLKHLRPRRTAASSFRSPFKSLQDGFRALLTFPASP